MHAAGDRYLALGNTGADNNEASFMARQRTHAGGHQLPFANGSYAGAQPRLMAKADPP